VWNIHIFEACRIDGLREIAEVLTVVVLDDVGAGNKTFIPPHPIIKGTSIPVEQLTILPVSARV
jgi:hypothetical protein